MPMERMTAKKIRIKDLVSGEWNKMDGMEPSFIKTSRGENVSRARIMATVVSKFISDDENFGSITLDDSSDTIRAKCFKDLNVLQGVEVGQLVDVIGKVREYNDEIYLIPEIIRQVKNPNLVLLRRLELLKKSKSGPVKEKTQGEKDKEEKEDVRKLVLDMISKSKEGIEYKELIAKSGKTEAEIENIVNELLAEGICYEPSPGKIRKI